MPSIPRFYPGRSSARNPILLCAETVRRARPGSRFTEYSEPFSLVRFPAQDVLR